jgi:hypothetical protein
MDHISLALRNSASTAISKRCARLLSDAEFQELQTLVEQTARRYATQDVSESIEGYLQDFEQLCLRYSLPMFRSALGELRISPTQKFFPRPDEVAAEIEAQLDQVRAAREAERSKEESRRKIEEFWRWAPEWMAITGYDEEELLKRWPCYRGTKGGAK